MSQKGGYKSDLSDEAWAVIEPLPKRRGPGRPMTLDLRAVVNGIFYVLRTGCQWSYLPHEYPNYNSVYYHFHKWSWDETGEGVNAALRAGPANSGARGATQLGNH